MDNVLMMGFSSPQEGGSERHIYELSNNLKLDVLTQKGSICKNKIELPTINSSILLRNLTFLLSCFSYTIYLLLSKRRYDVIHIHENLLYFLVPLLSLRYPVIVTVHGINGFKFYDNKFYWFFFRQPLKLADTLIAVNLEDQKKLSETFKNVVYIPNGVDLSIYKEISPKIENKITFIGRIHEQKGLLYLLEAFNKIEKETKLELDIIGEINDYARDLKKKFTSKKIKWLGYMSDRKAIVTQLKSSKIIVLPSLWEGLPLTLFEALASGRPVIVSDIPAFKSVIKDQAFFSKVANSEDLADKILSLNKNKKLQEELGKKGKKLADKYTWIKIAKNLENAYSSLK